MAILKFETIKPKNSLKPENSQGYSVTYLPQINSLLLYGLLSNSDVYLFSLTKKQWSLVKTSGKKPSFRRFYAHYYHKSLKGLIIHGGQIIEKQKKSKSSDECYILFTESWQWRKIFLPSNPQSRQLHQYFTGQENKNDQIFIFGGFSKPYDTFLNDLWSFKNLQNLSSKTNKHEVHGCESKLIQTKGQPPFIYGYAVKVIDSKALFFGGQSKGQKSKLEINCLCMKSFLWQKIDVFNKVCPSLICFNVYESGIDNDKLHIMGGISVSNNKPSEKCYSLGLKEMQILQEPKSKLPEALFNSCCITENPLCISAVELDEDGEHMQVTVMFEKQNSSPFSKHFETDEIEDSKEEASIEEYLKAIKHEQILSQELIKKNLVLEELFREIQNYTSSLYSKYLEDSNSEPNAQIEREKIQTIRSCEELKQSYFENSQQFEEALAIIKKLRGQLGLIHEDFQRCIQTEIDEEEN